MTNSGHHQFATSAFRATTTLTLIIIILAALTMVVTPVAVAVGDFNGDGLMDVVTANASANTVSVLLGHGDGTFVPHSDFAVEGAPIGIVVGDFNGDGKLDIATISGFDNAVVSVLIGLGDGAFKPYISTTAGTQGGSIAVGDFNGDGKLDVVISDNSVGVDIMLGNGNGTFQAPVGYATAADPRMVVVADFNGDGKLDLATTNAGSETISVLLGNGNGTFQTHKDNSTAKAASCISLTVGDLRNDGRQDIVAGCQALGLVGVLLSNGDGTFKAIKTYSVPIGVTDVAVGDVNGDGKLDVAVTNSGTNVSVLTGSGSGTLKAAVTFGTNFGPTGTVAVDLNGDGKADLVTANSGSPFGVITANVSVLLSNGKSLFAARTDYAVGSGTDTGAYNGIAAADLTGKGNPDLIVPITYSDEVSILMNKGKGTFAPPVNYQLPAQALGVVAGDFNNDGKPDVAVMTGGAGNISVLLNSGTGTFSQATSYAINGYGYSIAVGDFNKDGNLDIVATDYGSGTVSVLLGNGKGAFPSYVVYPTGTLAYSVTVGDFNHDGWPDLAVTNQQSQTVSILINKADGSGTFLPKVDYTIPGGPVSIAAGSFRGNGTLDLVVTTNSAFPGIVVLLGNNDGTFQTPVPYNTMNDAYAVTVGDFNNDGNLDLAVTIVSAGSNFGYVEVMPGAGDGTFGAGVTLATGALPAGVVAADFNGDGSRDLATANGTTAGDSGSASVLLNEPVVGVAPNSLIFKSQKVGTTSAAQVITVSNPGAAPLKITSITISGDFTQTNNCPAKLTTGKDCTVDVSFSPTQTGTRTGTLSIKDSALTKVQTIALTGSGS
jgi:hypothetical protein